MQGEVDLLGFIVTQGGIALGRRKGGEQIQLFAGLMGTEANRYISKRFALERYLGWSKEEIADNERIWRVSHEELHRSVYILEDMIADGSDAGFQAAG